MGKQNNSHRYAWLWAGVILTLCGISGSEIPKFSMVFGVDKLVHFFLFSIQAWLILRGDNPLRNRPDAIKVWSAILWSTLYGVMIEVLQGYVFFERSFDYWDMLANGIGALFIWLPVLILKEKKRRSKSSSGVGSLR